MYRAYYNNKGPWIRRFPWQQQSAHANEALKQLRLFFLSYLGQGARSLSIFLQLRQIFCR